MVTLKNELFSAILALCATVNIQISSLFEIKMALIICFFQQVSCKYCFIAIDRLIFRTINKKIILFS